MLFKQNFNGKRKFQKPYVENESDTILSIKVMKQNFFPLLSAALTFFSLPFSFSFILGGDQSINQSSANETRFSGSWWRFQPSYHPEEPSEDTSVINPLRVAGVSRYTRAGDEAVYLSSAAAQVHSGICITSSLRHHSVPLSPLCLTLPPNWHRRIWLGFTGWAVVAHTHKHQISVFSIRELFKLTTQKWALSIQTLNRWSG